MAIDRVNAVFIGKVKDSHGFACDLLEDPQTGARMLAYEPEVWWERGNYLNRLNAKANRTVPSGTPRNSWPATLGHHKKPRS